MTTTNVILEWLKNRAVLEENKYTQGKLRLAADTIERQAKEISEFNTEANRLVGINMALIKERDAALTEIQDTHQKTFDDLAAARAEIERLKARIAAANQRLRDIKGLHTVWYQKPKYEIEPDEEAKLISEMEQIAFSVHCYLEGTPGRYLAKAGEK